MNKIYVVLIIIGMLIMGIIIGKFYLKSTEIKRFCKPDNNFKNIYSLGEEKFLALSISDKVNDQMQYIGGDNNFRSVEDIVSYPIGQCDDYSTILSHCLDTYGIKNFEKTMPFNQIDGHHTYVVTKINGQEQILDASLDTISRFELFNDTTVVFDYWKFNTIAREMENDK